MIPQIIVAGHVCLDIMPLLQDAKGILPGRLLQAGPAILSGGGVVANTGLALYRLGIDVGLMGKIGDDLFGQALLDIFKSHDATLAQSMIVAKGEATSYSIVISPPNTDRTFLHCPGCNDTLSLSDLNLDQIKLAKIFHFGYPPLMRCMYENNGCQLAELLSTVRRFGVATSLDMALPDPESAAGHADWSAILRMVLPHVDIFTPSIEELLFMLDRPMWSHLTSGRGINMGRDITPDLLHRLSTQLLAAGVAVVLIKFGDQGAYLRSTADESRLLQIPRLCPDKISSWLGIESYHPCFQVKVVGTTGAGDTTIAGLLVGLLDGMPLVDALRLAVAVGACSVEAADAISGVRPLAEIERRIESGWPTL